MSLRILKYLKRGIEMRMALYIYRKRRRDLGYGMLNPKQLNKLQFQIYEAVLQALLSTGEERIKSGPFFETFRNSVRCVVGPR